jgi:phosphoglycolate phosphatase
MRRNTVIFDLDGTLINSMGDVALALGRVLAAEGLAPIPVADVTQYMGEGGKELVRRAFADNGRTLTPREVSALTRRFVEDYTANPVTATELYPDARAVLAELAEAGCAMAICTNKYEASARKVLELLGVDHFFGAVCGSDTFAVCKPDPGHVTGAVELLGRELASAVMLGDSTFDVHAAQAAGIPAIAVSWGYNDQPVERLGAEYVIDEMAQLPALLRQLD